MKQYLINLLSKVTTKVFLQGSLNPDESYPDNFMTFWNFETPENGFYDNAPSRAIWGFWVYVYSNDPEILEQMEQQVIDILKVDGAVVIQRKFEDVPSDVETHSGRMMTCYLIENYGG